MAKDILVLVMRENKTDLDKEEHSKLLPRYEGPYQITKTILEGESYEYMKNGKLKTSRIERLKVYKNRSERVSKEFGDLFEEVEEIAGKEIGMEVDLQDKEWLPRGG